MTVDWSLEYVSYHLASSHICSLQESTNGKPHFFKKCVVLCVAGLLCYIDTNIKVDKGDPFRNVVKRPGLRGLFTTLFEKFHVGIWSKMPMQELRPLIAHLLPKDVVEKLAFIYGREYCTDKQNYPWCYKMLNTLFIKGPSKRVCCEDQVLMVDVSPVSLRRTPDPACYIPRPFMGDLNIPNASRVIPNISTDIIPFIYPMDEHQSVSQYVNVTKRPGQLHYEVQQAIKHKQPKWKGIFW